MFVSPSSWHPSRCRIWFSWQHLELEKAGLCSPFPWRQNLRPLEVKYLLKITWLVGGGTSVKTPFFYRMFLPVRRNSATMGVSKAHIIERKELFQRIGSSSCNFHVYFNDGRFLEASGYFRDINTGFSILILTQSHMWCVHQLRENRLRSEQMWKGNK